MKTILRILCVCWMGLAFSAARADVQIANEKPKLSGAIEQAALPADSRVCPGSPVVLTVGLNPPLAISEGGIPEISYEVVEGNGWFGSVQDMKAAPLGPFGILIGRIKAQFGGQKAVTVLNAESGSTAMVFHPLGKDGDVIHVRAKGIGQASDLGSVDFTFKVGTNCEYLLSRLAENALNIEKRSEALHYEMEEFHDIKSADAGGRWVGNPIHVWRTFQNDKVISKIVDNGPSQPSTNTRTPLDVKTSIYTRCRYWGETDTALVGCLLDPDPPGPGGTLMLYYFDKQSGLMKEFRFYSTVGCGWGSFEWMPDIGGGLPFTVQIQRKVWNPPTKLQETVDIFRRNIKILPDVQEVETPVSYDPLTIDEKAPPEK